MKHRPSTTGVPVPLRVRFAHLNPVTRYVTWRDRLMEELADGVGILPGDVAEDER